MHLGSHLTSVLTANRVTVITYSADISASEKSTGPRLAELGGQLQGIASPLYIGSGALRGIREG